MRLPTHLILPTAACLSVLLLPGCSSADSRAGAALGEYQSAAAANDLPGSRQALLKLVRAKDDVADYWAELGKVQAAMGSYGEAYYAFGRAYELDRSNPELVRDLTEFALRSGDIGLAEKHARELEVVAPGDPWIKLADGWAAFSEHRYADAISASDNILSSSPFDPAAKMLKARALVGLDREDEAQQLLIEQVRVQQADAGNLELLTRIYERQENWPKVVETTHRLGMLNPADPSYGLREIRAAFRANDIDGGRKASLRLLQPKADPALISSVLDLWATYWPSQQRVQDARALANASSGTGQRLAYAAFLTHIGSPADAVRIAAPIASLPVTAGSAEANAVLGDGLSQSGRFAAAKARFDAVLAFDPGNATALRGRAGLELRTGNPAAAILDAQKLVTVVPNSARDRLLLATAYSKAGQTDWVDRTLWTALQEIPADEQIYSALMARRRGNADAMVELRAEFARQRAETLNRGLL
jgi:tetratricopeptide (TPR) repeat protein